MDGCKFRTWAKEVNPETHQARGNDYYAVVHEYEMANIPGTVYRDIKQREKITDVRDRSSMVLSAYDDESGRNSENEGITDGIVYRAGGVVGAFPFYCRTCNKAHLLLVEPKIVQTGDRQQSLAGMDSVSEMAAYAIRSERNNDGKRPGWLHCPEGGAGWSGKVAGGDRILLMLVIQYLIRMNELAQKDFRRHYLPAEDVLNGRLKGKLQVCKYLNRWASGKRLDMPCKWTNFTYDNWDNRALKSALACCQRWPKAGSTLHQHVRTVLSGGQTRLCFDEVADVASWEVDFGKTRLRAVSKPYREALNVAEQIVRHVQTPTTSVQTLKTMWIDTNELFEDFVNAMAKAASEHGGYTCAAQEGKKLFKQETMDDSKTNCDTMPDVTISKGNDVVLIVDAKYKKLLDATWRNDVIVACAVCKEDDDRLKAVNADMYQMLFYLASRQCMRGLIVYPFWKADNAEIREYGPLLFNIDDVTFNAKTHAKTIGAFEVRFLGLNLAKPIRDVFEGGRNWLMRLLGECI